MTHGLVPIGHPVVGCRLIGIDGRALGDTLLEEHL